VENETDVNENMYFLLPPQTSMHANAPRGDFFQHPINQSGKPMSPGGDDFRVAELAARASVLRAEVRLASQ
jgi:hypothetical protein